MEVNSKLAKEMAKKVVREHNLRTVPIDLDVIFEAKGFKKVEINKPNGIDGVIMDIPGKGTIVAINKAKPFNRIRFTLAHELGHIFLHHDKRDIYDGEKVRELDELGQEELPSCTPAKETEANIFASELLIPLEQLKKFAKQGYELDKLAEIFQVSKHAMSIAFNNNWRYLK
ncbi:MAG: ImmA/IrrE family metallo-endopeptidase [Desulfuromonadales bacterium]|nr:ImmA/IrrE family metallo-endopeptidase [Desulfuromonadales bacterium]